MLFANALGRLTANQQKDFRDWQRRARRYRGGGSRAEDGRQVVENLTEEEQLGRDGKPAEEVFREFLERLGSTPKGRNVKQGYESACEDFPLKGPRISGRPPSLVSRFVAAKPFLEPLQEKLGLPIGSSSSDLPEVALDHFLRRWRSDPDEVRSWLKNVWLAREERKVVFLTFEIPDEDRGDPVRLWRRMGKDPSPEEREAVVELKVPHGKLRKKKYPTICDAEWHGNFKPSKLRDEFGVTLNLNEDPPGPGVPEFVAENRPADCAKEIEPIREPLP